MTNERRDIDDLLGAYALDALDALDPAIAAEVEFSIDQNHSLELLVDRLRAAVDPLITLAEDAPPSGLAERVLAHSLSSRPAGSALDTEPAAPPAYAYRSMRTVLDTLLSELDDAQWTAPTRYGIRVDELVAHLAAVEHYTGDRLGLWPTITDEALGHLALGRDTPADDLKEAADRWRRRSDLVADRAHELGAAELETRVSLHGVDLTVAEMLVVRTFETWAHSLDICTAVGRPPVSIESGVLHTMAGEATGLVARVGAMFRDHRDKSIRFTLTGPGGGSWGYMIGGDPLGHTTSTDAVVVADVIDFCLLAADHRPLTSVDISRSGDSSLVDDLLTMTPMLADYGERHTDH